MQDEITEVRNSPLEIGLQEYREQILTEMPQFTFTFVNKRLIMGKDYIDEYHTQSGSIRIIIDGEFGS